MSLESGYTARLIIYRPGGTLELDFEQWDGGNVNPGNTKHRGAQARRQTARGGLRTRTDVTLRCECNAAVWAVKDSLEDASGIDRCQGIKQMVDARASVVGKPLVVTGIVGDVNYPPYDLSGDAVGLLEVTIQADEDRG